MSAERRGAREGQLVFVLSVVAHVVKNASVSNYSVCVCLFVCLFFYKFEAVLAYLTVDGEEADDGEPAAPHEHLVQVLQVEHAEYEYELEEDEVPEVVFDMLDRSNNNNNNNKNKIKIQ